MANEPAGLTDLKKIAVMILDDNAQCQEILIQILIGFGVSKIHRCSTSDDAERLMMGTPIDLALVDAVLPGKNGYEWTRWLRSSCPEPACYTPVIIVTSHTSERAVLQARDSGASFTISKPLTPAILARRIGWVARDTRKFVRTPTFCGPDRRFKFAGPPPGTTGRRESDLKGELGLAKEPNMSQSDIDALMMPQRLVL